MGIEYVAVKLEDVKRCARKKCSACYGTGRVLEYVGHATRRERVCGCAARRYVETAVTEGMLFVKVETK